MRNIIMRVVLLEQAELFVYCLLVIIIGTSSDYSDFVGGGGSRHLC